MKVHWLHPKCIVCREKTKLSQEHLIPASLGGVLVSHLLCRACNSSFGSGFEAKARLAHELRKAASGLRDKIGDLVETLERGTENKSDFDGVGFLGKVRRDGQISVATLSDGSLIVPENETARQIGSHVLECGGSLQDAKRAISI